MGTWLRLVAILSVSGGLSLSFAASAWAEPAGAPVYLALGDSVAFGFRTAPLQDYANPNNFAGYPELLAQLTGMQLTNASCPGETTSSFLSSTGADNGCRLFRQNFPLHTPYPLTQTQLSFAIDFLRSHPQTRLITIDLGANDLFLLQAACANSTQCVLAQLPTLLQTVGRNLDIIYDDLRAQAGYNGRLVGLTYYATNYRDAPQVEAVGSLDLVIAVDTLTHAGRVADGFGAFALASRQTNGDACAAGLLAPLPTGCEVHPSARGQDLLAQTIRAVLDR